LCAICSQIQQQNINAGFAEDAPLGPFGVLLDQAAQDFRVQVPRARHAVYLVKRGCRTDMRIESAARRCDQVYRNRLRILRIGSLQLGDARFDRFQERRIGGA